MGNRIHNPNIQVQGYMQGVRSTWVGSQALAVFWLGQAGFMLKTPQGRLITIDPYLTDSCQQDGSFKRIMLPVLPPGEFETDDLFISHDHGDHFDVDLMRILSAKSGIRVFGPASCLKRAAATGISFQKYTVLEENQRVDLGEFQVIPVKADHGELAPDALGFIFDFGFVKVYFAGDTAYSPALLQNVYAIRPEIALLPINGEYGNLNSAEAARLAGEIGAKVLIPCHYWTFIEHGAFPIELKRIFEQQDKGVDLIFLTQGEGYLYQVSK